MSKRVLNELSIKKYTVTIVYIVSILPTDK